MNLVLYALDSTVYVLKIVRINLDYYSSGLLIINIFI